MTLATSNPLVGCPLFSMNETDGGWAGRRIAGVVPDSAGTPVEGVHVEGYHTGVGGSEGGVRMTGFRA